MMGGAARSLCGAVGDHDRRRDRPSRAPAARLRRSTRARCGCRAGPWRLASAAPPSSGSAARAGAGRPLSPVSSVHTACAVATLDSSLPPGSAISWPTVAPVRRRNTVRAPCGLPPAILTSRAELQHGRRAGLVPISRSRSVPSNARSRTSWVSGTRSGAPEPAVLVADRRIPLRCEEWSSLKTPNPRAVWPLAENASCIGSTSSEYGPATRNGACQPRAGAGARDRQRQREREQR